MADKKADKKGGGSDGGPDDIMSSAEMKPLLAKAKRGDPVSCAIALTKDKEGVILLDKRKKPKKLRAELKKQAEEIGLELEMTTLRFGRASVDTDEDAALVTFTINKEAPGAMRPKLLERVKKAGFTKIELTVDANIEAEAEEDEEEGQAAPATAPGASAAASQAPPQAPPEAPPQAPPQAQGGGGQIAALQNTLADMLKQMPAMLAQAPDQKAALLKLAQAATAAVKSSDPAQAQPAIDQLSEALDAAQSGLGQSGAANGAANGASPNGTSPAADKGAMKLVATSRMAWSMALKKIESDIDTLLTELTKVYKDHGIASDLERIFRAKVDPMMASFDEALGEKLDELSGCTDPAQFAPLVAEARQILKRYQASLGAEPLIAKLDANPVAPIAVGKTMTMTLQTLDKTLASVAARG